MGRLLLILLMGLATLLTSAGGALAQDVNPLTGKPYSQKVLDYREQMKAEDARMDEANEIARAEDEALRKSKAADIAADDARTRQWMKDHPAPPGTKEVLIAPSYGDGYVLEQTRIIYFNDKAIPTHEVELGPDGQASGPVRLTQQGKVWETVGPNTPEGGKADISYGEAAADGEKIIDEVTIYGPGGKPIATYQFNDDGLPWKGERFDPVTGQRTGGFYDPKFEPPPSTFGAPLAVPTQLRLITGACEKCRPLADRHNELAAEINGMIVEMQSLSQQHQATNNERARVEIRKRHAVLEARIKALMAQYEAARAAALACACPPPAEPPQTPALTTGQPPPESILDEIDEDAGLDALDDRLDTPPPESILDDLGEEDPDSILDDLDEPAPPTPSASEPAVLPTAMAYPADDSDLEAVLARAQAYIAAANCEGMECPKIDCDEARRALQALIDMEAYLKHMVFYAELADADHLAHFKSLADAGILNGEQRDWLIRVIALQEFYHNFGSMMLDIASVSSWVKDVASGEKALKDMSPTEVLDQFNSLYQAAKDFESGVTTVAGSLSGKPVGTPIGSAVDIAGGVDSGFINDTTSTITDLKSIAVEARKIMEEAKLNGTDWREGLKKSGVLAAAGQIAGRYLKGWSARNLAERQQRLNDLLRDADAGDISQAASFIALQRAQRRRWASIDALAAVQEARAAYEDCVSKVCGWQSFAGPVIPEFERTVPGTDTTKYSWGEALRWLNGAIAQTLPKLNPALFKDECPPQDKTYAGPGQPLIGVLPGPAPLPDDVVRPQFGDTALSLPASFCSEFERNDYLAGVYNPAAAAALTNVTLAQGYTAKLNFLFTDYMRNEGGPVWAAIQREMADFKPIADDVQRQAEAMPGLYAQILAIPVVDCPKLAGDDTVGTIPSAGQPLTPVDDPKPKPGKPDCPPEDRRKPIRVGTNGQVGSGARFKAKAASTALGIAGGLLGGGGGGSPLGGGGGGGGGPQTVICKIKDSEMTVFTDPVTGVSLRVGAKRAGGTVVVFADVAKSPDNGTFQTAFMENANGDTLAPADVGICELWGEWKLTVSWTKSTYVDGQLVSQESGGWSKSGLFSIPGVLSTVNKPDGLWKRLGFSNASHGARKIALQYRMPAGQGPVDFIIHITQPGGDPVMTVPFAIRMVEGPGGGFTLTKAPEEPCPPPESILDDIGDSAPPPESILDDIEGSQPRAPAPPSPSPSSRYGLPPIRVAPPPPPTSGTVTDPDKLKKEFEDNLLDDHLMKGALGYGVDELKTKGLNIQKRHELLENLDRWKEKLAKRLAQLDRIVPTGPSAEEIRKAVLAEKIRTQDMLRQADELKADVPPLPSIPEQAPAPKPSSGDEAPESILDDIDESPPVIG